MMQIGRVLALSSSILAVAVLAGCSSTDARRATAVNVQPTAYAATNAGTAVGTATSDGALSLTGRWYLNDEFERDCYVNLSAEAIDAVRRVARATGECSGMMVHVGGWAVYNAQSEIRFYDKTGRVIGELKRNEANAYKGSLSLTTGQTVIATLRQI